LSYSAAMARSKQFSISRNVFKFAKAANNMRKVFETFDEPLQRSSPSPPRANARTSSQFGSKSTTGLTPVDEAYEAKVLGKLGSSVDRHLYIKLVGINSRNPDGSSRKEAIQQLVEGQQLELRRERDNKFDPNAILVGAVGRSAAGYLPTRLGGDVTRSMNKGVKWRCFVRRVLHSAGSDHWGVTVCLVKFKKEASKQDSKPGMSGTEFLARHYPDYKSPATVTKPNGTGAAIAVVILLALFIVMMIHSC
jgi:hypothetical protein